MPNNIPTVDGLPVALVHGSINGNGGAVDKISGTDSNDSMQGLATFNQYNGGAGNDTFVLTDKWAVHAGAHDGQSTVFTDQFAYITDFEGAGQLGGDIVSLNGDWIASSLTLTHTGATSATGATLYYYSISDNTGHTFNFEINSLSGNALAAGDFRFVS